jgi:hypothetical protein
VVCWNVPLTKYSHTSQYVYDHTPQQHSCVTYGMFGSQLHIHKSESNTIFKKLSNFFHTRTPQHCLQFIMPYILVSSSSFATQPLYCKKTRAFYSFFGKWAKNHLLRLGKKVGQAVKRRGLAKMQNIDNFIPPSSIYIYCEVFLYVHQNKPLNRKPAARGKNDIFFAASCTDILAFQLCFLRLSVVIF